MKEIKYIDYLKHFLPVDASDVTIEVLEERLIAALLPPCNSRITVKSIKRAVNAF